MVHVTRIFGQAVAFRELSSAGRVGYTSILASPRLSGLDHANPIVSRHCPEAAADRIAGSPGFSFDRHERLEGKQHMTLIQKRQTFDLLPLPKERAKPVFHGVPGFDVYNPSIPFSWKGQRYIFGRVERRGEWARSWVRLFSETAPDRWTLVPNSMIYQLEDPYVATIAGELILGGTHVRFQGGQLETYYGYFYRGTDLHDLKYFTTGPDYMKDIRLVELANGKIGVFSRPRNEEIMKKYGSESMVGFCTIDSLDQLNAKTIAAAPYVPGLFDNGEWGGCNQAYLLDSGLIGLIGHKCYKETSATGVELQVYFNIALVFDPKQFRFIHEAIVATRKSYPDGPAKRPNLTDCAFSSGIALRPDGLVDLYSGIGDTEVGRVAIPNPFAAYGKIVTVPAF